MNVLMYEPFTNQCTNHFKSFIKIADDLARNDEIYVTTCISSIVEKLKVKFRIANNS